METKLKRLPSAANPHTALRAPNLGLYEMRLAALTMAFCVALTSESLGQRVGQSTHDQELLKNVFLIQEPRGNLLVVIGKQSTLVVGSQLPGLVTRAQAIIASHRAPMPEYVLVASVDSSLIYRDAGWGKRGAITIGHENLRVPMLSEPPHEVGGDPPTLGFSEVLQLGVADDEAHLVHQPAASSAADVGVHFEIRHFLYLGGLFTTDGYPTIDAAKGGTLSGMIEGVHGYLRRFSLNPRMGEPIVPGRGGPSSFGELRSYCEMLRSIYERVRPMIAKGETLDGVLNAHPTASFDARWGHGPVTPDRFVSMVYASFASEARSGKKASEPVCAGP